MAEQPILRRFDDEEDAEKAKTIGSRPATGCRGVAITAAH